MTVIIGIDPHKRSHTAVALDEHDEVLDQIRIEADRRQIARLLGWAKRWPDRIWAIENANGLGWLLSRQLVDHGEQVRDVPAALAAQVRKLSGSGHKTDAHDARSTAIAGRHARVLREVVPDGTPQVLGLLIERRWHIVSARQKTLVRIHEQLSKLQPGGGSARVVGRQDRPAAAHDPPHRPSREDAPTDRGRAAHRAAGARPQAQGHQHRARPALEDYGTCLTEIDGIGRVAAATIIAIVGDVRRFPTADHFASFSGTAPIAASSGEVVRYRLNLGGQRQVNKILHTAAKAQSSMPTSAGRAYVTRPLGEGKTRAEAIRSLKRHLSNVVYRALLADAVAHEVSGEDNRAA